MSLAPMCRICGNPVKEGEGWVRWTNWADSPDTQLLFARHTACEHPDEHTNNKGGYWAWCWLGEGAVIEYLLAGASWADYA